MSQHKEMIEPNMVQDLVAEHRFVEACFKQFEIAMEKKDVHFQHAISHAAMVAIVLHSRAEMEYLYPLAGQKLGSKGKELAKRSLEEHKTIENLLAEIDHLRSGGHNFQDKFHEVVKNMLQHNREEENELFPLLIESISKEELQQLSEKANAFKARADIRPHKAGVGA